MLKRRKFLLKQVVGGKKIKYLLNDCFTTLETAPIASPRACEPGPGEITVVDAGNILEIASDGITNSAALDATTGFGTLINTSTEGIGMLSLAKPVNSGCEIGTTPTIGARPLINGWCGNVSIRFGSTFMSSIVGVIDNTFATKWVIGTGSAVAFVIDGTLVWIGIPSVYLKNYFAFGGWSGTGHVVKRFAVIDLPASGYKQWSTYRGIATSYTASPSEGDSQAMKSNAIVDLTIDALPTSGSVIFDVRRTDNNNAWYVEVDSAGQIWLYEILSGTATARITGAASDVSPGDRIRIICDYDGSDDLWMMYVGTTKIGEYTGSSNGLETNTTACLRQVGTGATVSDFTCWPRDVSRYLPKIS